MEVKKYFCKAGVKGMQVGLTSGPFYRVLALRTLGRRASEQLRLGKCGSTQGVDLIFSLQLHGILRVILEPLTGDLPIVGAVSMFFIKRPVRRALVGDGRHGAWVWEERWYRWVAMDLEKTAQRLSRLTLPRIRPDSSALLFQMLDINWTGMTNLLDIPGLRYWAPSQVAQFWAEGPEIQSRTL